MPKRYYWLKLKEDFFDREEIRIIEQMENGKDYIIFYLKLLLKSIKTDGILRFKDILPYNPKMLSVITDTNIDIVRSAIDLFTHFGMMEKWDDGTLFMVETVNMIGSESESAERMRRLRARRKQKQLPGGTNEEKIKCDVASQCDVDVRKSDTDIDIDIDIKEEEEEERQFELRKKLSAITGIDFGNQTGTEAVQRWAKKYPPEIIYLSAEITALHAQKPNIQYMEQVLQDWEKKGWNTAAKIKDGMARAKDRKRPQSFGVGSSKSKKYEEDAEIYVSPVTLARLGEAP